VLAILEQRSAGSQGPSGLVGAVLDDLPLFTHQPPAPKPVVNPLDVMLDTVRPDELSPKAALDLVYELKKTRDAARRS
jgi:DNA mismatch repair protein MutS